MPLDLPRPPARKRNTTARPAAETAATTSGAVRNSQGRAGLQLPPKRGGVTPSTGPAKTLVSTTVTTLPVVTPPFVTAPYFKPNHQEQPSQRPTDRLGKSSASWTTESQQQQQQHVVQQVVTDQETSTTATGSTTSTSTTMTTTTPTPYVLSTTTFDTIGSLDLSTNQEGLPKGWTIHYTDDGKPYYTDIATGQSTWDRPPEDRQDETHEPDGPQENMTSVNHCTEVSASTEQQDEQVALEATVPTLPPGWVRAVTDTGGVYYWNESEQISTWEVPEVDVAATSHPGVVEDSAVFNSNEDQSIPPDQSPQEDEPEEFQDHPPMDLPVTTETIVVANDPVTAEQLHVDATMADSVPLPPGWIEDRTDEGVPFYYNQDDGTSSWERPILLENNNTLCEPEPEMAPVETVNVVESPAGTVGTSETDLVVAKDDNNPPNDEIKTIDGDDSIMLPPGWKESLTEFGEVFYFNEVDGTTSWVRPQLESDIDKSTPATAAEQNVNPFLQQTVEEKIHTQYDMGNVPAEDGVDVAAGLPPGWYQDFTDDGQAFYYNEVDGSTSWDPPQMDNYTIPEEMDADAVMEDHNAEQVSEVHLVGHGDTPETTVEVLSYASEAVNGTSGKQTAEASHGLILPPGWSQRQTVEGETFYCNDADGTTCWELPHFANDLIQEETNEGYLDEAPETSIEKDEKIDVPPGWMQNIDDDGIPFFSRPTDDEHDILTAANLHDRFENETVEKQSVEDFHRASSVKSDEFSYEDINHEPERVDNGVGFAPAPESTTYGAGESLPNGWVFVSDENTGSYYFNETEGRILREKPDFVVADRPECLGQVENNPVETDHAILPLNWQVLKSDDGTPYYVNELTGETTWIKPDPMNGQNDISGDVRAEDSTNEWGKSSPFTALEATSDRPVLQSDNVPENTCPQVSELQDPSMNENQASDGGVGLDDNDLLPNGWSRVPVGDGGFYYHNEETNETSWERPKMEQPSTPAKYVTDDEVTEHDSDNVEISEGQNASNPLPSGWSQHISDDGASYYFNEVTNETSWERPLPCLDDTSAPPREKGMADESVVAEAMASLKQPVSANIESSECDLNANAIPESGRDPVSLTWEMDFNNEGEAYYYCHQTGETTWDKPESYVPKSHTAESSPSHAELSLPLEPQLLANSSGSSHKRSSLHVVGKRSGACVSVGFGGRLCVLQLRQNASVLTIKTIHIEASRERICAVEKCKHSQGFSGPLATAEHSAVSRYIDFNTSESKNDLWHLVSIAAESKGRLQSVHGAIDPTSPEARIVQILLRSDYQFVEYSSSAYADSKSENLEVLERLLLNGQRKDALQAALDCGNFAMAMIIAKVVEDEDRHHVYRTYLDQSHFHGKALRTISLLFSESPALGETISYWDEMADETLMKTWKHHLAGILSNPIKGWNRLVISLGQRLQRIEKAGIVPSQFCYLVGGGSVGTPSSGAPIWLLGYDQACHALHLHLDAAVESFALTEAYEWSKRQGNRNASIACLQGLKVWYALILCEYGYVDTAEKYLRSCIEHLDSAAKAGTNSCGSSDATFAGCVFSGDANAILGVARQLKNRLDGEYVQATSPPGTHDPSGVPVSSPKQDLSFVTACGDTSMDEMMFSSPIASSGPTVSPIIPAVESMKSSENPNLSKPTTAGGQSGQSQPLSQRPNLPSLDTDGTSSEKPPLITPVAPAGNPKPREAPKSAPANLQPISKPGETKSFFSKEFKHWVAKRLNPKAVIADPGDSMQAYYDADKKVWVFPGEDPAEKAKPIAPPPTAMSSPAPAAAPAAAAASNDPLAAMMAPPPRPLKPSSATKPTNGSSLSRPPGTMGPPGGRPPVNFQAFMVPKPSDT